MSELSPIGHIRATLQRLYQTADKLDRAHYNYLIGKLREIELQHGARVSELLAANNAEVEKRRAIQTELVRQRISNALLQDDHDKHYARAEALSLKLRRLQDGQPDGHQRPRQPGLVSSEPVVGD